MRISVASHKTSAFRQGAATAVSRARVINSARSEYRRSDGHARPRVESGAEPARRRLPEVDALADENRVQPTGPMPLLSPMARGARANASQPSSARILQQQQQQHHLQYSQPVSGRLHPMSAHLAPAPAPFLAAEGAHVEPGMTTPRSTAAVSAGVVGATGNRMDAVAATASSHVGAPSDQQGVYVNAQSLSKSQGFMQNYLQRDSYHQPGSSAGGSGSSYSRRMGAYGNHALQYRYPSRLLEVSLTLRDPGHDEVLVQVTHSGVSATDLHILADSAAPHIMKIVPGQDVVGKVVSMGRNVTGLNLDDLVCVCPHFVPPMDEFARSGRITVGRDSRSMGINKNGAWGQFCCVNAVQVFRLAPEFQPEWAVLTHEMSAVLNGWRQLQPSLRHEFPRVLVVGGSGLAAILWLLLLRSKGVRDLHFLDTSSRRARVAQDLDFQSSVMSKSILEQLERRNQNNADSPPPKRLRKRKPRTRRSAVGATSDMTFAGAATSTSYAKSLYASSFAQKMAEHFYGKVEFSGNETSGSSLLDSDTPSEDSDDSQVGEREAAVPTQPMSSSAAGSTAAQMDEVNRALEQIGSISIGPDDKDFSAVETSGVREPALAVSRAGDHKSTAPDSSANASRMRPRKKLRNLENMLECMNPPVMGHFDIVIDCSGDGNVLHGLLHVVLPGGSVLLNGTGMLSTGLLLSPIQVYSKELRVIGATAHPSTFVDALAHVHRIQEEVGALSALGARLYSISEYNIALDDARRGEVTKSLFWMSDPRDRNFLANPSTPLLSPAQTPVFNVPILSL
ncbi:L-threonine 3-dehydrogenase [Porphyridium purpureum]|uniref:L-threonine 3-dehydrogenase n=1 Tax=Porphyridium purpureum TaxID=35688 RepID=A0A5J4YTM7_PORPP|nr:L-threonine 3-dehydrogenase [Porphyridium purpureum]|eukprot:POR9399..scf227_4